MAKFFEQPSVMTSQQHFAQVPTAEIQRSRFDRSHGNKLTMNAAGLVPIYVDEVLPGDSFDMKETAFARLSTPLRPVMDNLYLETFYFFVPSRLVWDNWQRFMGERSTPTDDPSTLTIPTVTFSNETVTHNSLPHYMGLPLAADTTLPFPRTVSALPFRAYVLIWNEWFRDQNLHTPGIVQKGDGPDLPAGYLTVIPRSKRHDYFTSCLPWPQKGDPVMIPVGDIVPVPGGLPITVHATGDPGNAGALQVESGGGGIKKAGTAPGAVATMVWDDPQLMISMEESTGATINDLRTAFQIQRLLERDARGGSRYTEILLSHYGVVSPDARLQRPEYLGGGSTRVNVAPVPATFTGGEVATGDLGAVGTAVNRGSWNKSFTEHGYIIGLANVRADLTYQNHIDKLWLRRTRFDFYWPALANLGEQAVLTREIYDTGDTNPGLVFGYQERYAEYRYKPSRITGRFCSQDPQSIDIWHLSQDFDDAIPVLNASFITDQPPIDRIVAVPTEPHFLMDVYFHLQCSRPMPVYSVPGMVDHF